MNVAMFAVNYVSFINDACVLQVLFFLHNSYW